MSSPLGWRSAGNSFTNRALSEGHPAWTAALIDESIQVSNTSVSPFKSLDPHLGHFSRGGGSLLGSLEAWVRGVDSAVFRYFLDYRQAVFLLPFDIHFVSECAHHHCSGSERGIDFFVCNDRNLLSKDRDYGRPSHSL